MRSTLSHWFARSWLRLTVVAFAIVIVVLFVLDLTTSTVHLQFGTVGDWVPGLALLIAVEEFVRARRTDRIEALAKEINDLAGELGGTQWVLGAIQYTRQKLHEYVLDVDEQGRLSLDLNRLAAQRMFLVGSLSTDRPAPDKIQDPDVLGDLSAIFDVAERLDPLAVDEDTPEVQPRDVDALLEVLRDLRDKLDRFCLKHPSPALIGQDQIDAKRQELELLQARHH